MYPKNEPQPVYNPPKPYESYESSYKSPYAEVKKK